MGHYAGHAAAWRDNLTGMIMKALIVMAKRPLAGLTKTRLVPPFSFEDAAEMYGHILLDVLELVRGLDEVTPFVAYSPVDKETASYFRKLVPDFGLIPQEGATLGERLDGVLSSCLREGYNQVAAMNSDSPTLPSAYLAEAFERLDKCETDVVLGPCEDGGYYLIGWKQQHARLVRDVQMSTEQVLADTLQIAKEEGLKVELLQPWFDVDELSDLERISADEGDFSSPASHTRSFLLDRVGIAPNHE